MFIKFENPTNGRYYYIHQHCDLLGDLVLTVIRGGKNVNIIRHFGFDNIQSLQKDIYKRIKARLNNGYIWYEMSG